MHRRVAIIAYSVRFPGTDTQNFWNDLLAQKDLVTEVDPARWSKQSLLHPDKRHPGSSYTFAAGSLGDISAFDAAFFGISPREAALMDPQQRLLLELSWETFENAGIVPSSLRGSDCGVYIGISSVDYAYRLADDLAAIDSSAATGTISSIAANRISYIFDLHGPSIAMDTACSSSLVAFHQACQAIRTGEISQALAGGINLHLHPFGFISFSKATMLSKTGRCHVFDEAGDGYVRSEGGGLFLLKDYNQAVTDGDQILAVVAGSGVNTDGHKSGLTIPNPLAQASLMSRVYEQAGIDPEAIDYFEAHGTGTAVGDPIEAHAIGLALGQKRKKPLLIGSIKSNLGHLESASGVAGLAKVLSCIQHRAVPATIGIKNPNPNIKFDDWNIEVVTEAVDLKSEGKLIVGVNSFGFGGANAHVILESHTNTPKKRAKQKKNRLLPLILSSKDIPGLSLAAQELANFLESANDDAFYDIAHTALFRREQHQQCAVVFSQNAKDAADQLKRFSAQETVQDSSVHTGIHLDNTNGPAFVYSGNGCQWQEMGKQLLVESAIFRRTIIEIDGLFSQYADFSLLDELSGLNGSGRYQYTEIAQPALFAVQVGISEILRENGIRPIAVTGHSVGEVAAAWACGALSLAEAVKVIYYRSHYQGKTKGQGQMTAIGLSEQEITPLLNDPRFSDLHLAGINSNRGVTIAGSAEQLSLLETEIEARNIFFKRLDLDYAFHSPAMNAIESGVRLDLAQLDVKQPSIAFFSTVTGAIFPDSAVGQGQLLDAEYWWHNIRHPVLFQQASAAMLNIGISTFIEIGGHPVLQSYLKDCLKAADTKGIVIPTLIRGKDSANQVMSSVAQAIMSGADFDQKHWFPVTGRFVELPNYAWQREKLWHTVTSESHGLLMREKIHPLLGYKLKQHDNRWENQLDIQLLPYLADHNVGGAVVFPGAGFAEIALAAAFYSHAADTVEIEELEIRSPLLLSSEHSKVVRFSHDGADGRFMLRSREFAVSSEWSPHIVGRFIAEATGRKLEITAPNIPDRTPDFDINSHAQLTEYAGLQYGDAFKAISHGWTDHNSALAVFKIPESISAELDHYFLHPALLDCTFQLIFQVLKDEIHKHEGMAFVPTKLGRINLRTNKAVPHSATATLLHRSPHSLNAEFALYDSDGNTIAVLNNVRFRAVRLHRQHAQHLHYLDYHLTAAPLGQQLTPDRHRLHSALSNAIQQSHQESAGLRYSEEVEPLLDSLCAQFVVEALRDLSDSVGFLSDSVVNTLYQTNPKSAALLRSAISVAIENQALSVVDGEGWRINQEALAQDISATEIWNTLVQEYPDYFYLINLTGRIGIYLTNLINGDIQASDLSLTPALYAHISSHILEQTGKKTLTDVLINECTRIIQTLATGERLSILEISPYKPEFAALLCSQLDFNQSDYRFASLCDNAINAAESLHERFPLLQSTRIPPVDANNSESTSNLQTSPANFAIVNLSTINPQEIHHLLAQLPTMLIPGSPVIFIGQQPARWIDIVLGGSEGWWIAQDSGELLSPQLSASQVAEQLQALNFHDTQTLELIPGSYSGTYLITTGIEDKTVECSGDGKNWLILTGQYEPENSLAQRIAGQLKDNGNTVVLQKLQDNGSMLQEQLINAKAQGKHFDHIIHLAGFGQHDAFVQTERCWLATQVIQALEATSTHATLWLLTHNVGSLFPCDQSNADLAADSMPNDAALWGFGRSLMNEASNYGIKLLDISGANHSDSLLKALITELTHENSEQEIVSNADGKRFVPRLRNQEVPRIQQPPAEQQTLRLSFKLPGQLRNLHWESTPDRSPADNEIEVEVKATGLNFRDVMYTLGLLSDEAVENGFVGPTLGLEFAGIVTRTGKDVSAFQPGDHVVGLGPASFSNRVITQANAIALIPDKIAFAAAATIPSTFFTVYYALHYQARLQAGEKILIHGAAGGVGIAAIQIAQWLGAEIYATVGSEEKRDFLRLMGIEHIHDSRSLSFAEEILAKTDNKGVDVVLNSLAGEAINRNFQVLKPFGRFLELGKRDFYENTRIGLRPFRNNISYFGIDADQLMQERPALTRELFTDMMQLFHQGILHPLPYTTFDANQVIDAFRYMQQSKQIGKIVVTYDNGIHAKPAASESPKQYLTLSPDASYLVTGGLGGFGLRTAQWLVEKGARHLILISRTGPATDEAKTALAAFAEQGVAVHAAACDVTDKAALRALLDHCDAAMPPLKGIIHSATVIDDSLVRNMDRDQISRVFDPKIQGALYLHELTLDKSLDLFVMYSSATTLFGNPGQANYVAANFWLEGLASARRQQGLPATCVCWGAIDDVGFLARNEKQKALLQNRMGGSALASAAALNALELIMTSDSRTLGVMEFDWRALSSFLPTARSPKFRELAVHTSDSDNSDDNRADMKRLLDELSDEALQSTFIDILKEELSQILLVSKEKIDPNHSMYDMGLDSLMGVELMIAIESRFDVQIPVMALSEAPTLSKLAERLIAQLRGEKTAPDDKSANTQAQNNKDSADILASINDLAKRHGSNVTQTQIDALTEDLKSGASVRMIS